MDNTSESSQDRFVMCQGIKTRVRLSGDNGPWVVFVSAFPGSLLDWSLVQPEVAAFAKTASYDRAGIGKSDRFIGETKTPQQYVAELDCLVSDLAGDGPVVLVAHSSGGIIARQFYRHFPSRVVGMVLVDSSHEQQGLRLSGADAELKGMEKGLTTELRLARLGILRVITKLRGERLLPPSFQKLPREAKTELLEGAAKLKQCKASMAEFRAIKLITELQLPNLDDLPLIVLEAEQNSTVGWHELQVELANLSSRSELRLASNSGHYIQLDNPQSVVQAVQDVLALDT